MHGVRRPALLAVLGLLACLPAGAAQPEQVHASWLGDGTVGVTWVRTGDVTATSQDVLQLGGPGNGSVQSVQPDSLSYIAPGVTVHKAVAQVGDALGISYRVGSEADGWSQAFGLAPPPAAGEPWRFVAYGDMGTGVESEASAALPAAVLAQGPDMVLHLGDISYANGDPRVWDEWFRLVEPLAASTLYMATPGNHEHEGNYVASGPSPDQAPFVVEGLDPYEQYRERFLFPSIADELYYSVDLGPVHVVALNSEDLCVTQPLTYMVPWRASPGCGTENANVPEGQRRSLPNEEVLGWLEADLAAHADAAWTFVFLHRPVYSAGAYTGELVLREHFVPVFERHGVDLVLSGHDHNYQRSHPLVAGQPVALDPASVPRDLAPVYIVSGGGGEGYYTLDDDAPAWTAARTEAFHFLVLDVGEESLSAQVVDTLSGEVLDAFVIGPSAPVDIASPADVPERGSPLPVAAAWLGIAVATAVAWRRRR